LILFWLILTRSLVAYLATVAPEAALFLRSVDPTALVTLAETELNFSDAEKTEPEERSRRASVASRLRAQVETALAVAPLNARSYRLLGQLAEIDHAGRNTTSLMQAAVRHSLNESIAAEWMMRTSFADKHYPAAGYYADILLRARPQLMSYAIPVLARMVENKAAVRALADLLASNPPWRAQFFSALGATITDPRAPLEILLRLKDTAAPPTTADLQGYLLFLFQHKLYDLAYYTWLQFLPSEQMESAGFLFNGSFETRPSGLPFDWQMPQGAGFNVDIAKRPDALDKHALYTAFGQGRVNFPGVFQSVALSPGAHRFKGSFKGEIRGRRGMQWIVSCTGGAVIGESQMILGFFPVWQSFEFTFTAPDDCPSQSVRLVLAARSASEQLVSGSIWFDDLSIERQQQDYAGP
jgi:hypothetical protein